MVDVTHDRDHGRTGPEILRILLLLLFDLLPGRVLLFALGREAELFEEQLDLVEVEPLIDRDHQPEVLERGADDRRSGLVHQLGELGDGEELVHPDRAGLALLLLLLLHLLELELLLGRALTLPALLLAAPALQLSHHAAEVVLDLVLVDAALPFLLATTLAAAIRRVSLGLDPHRPPRSRARGGGRRLEPAARPIPLGLGVGLPGGHELRGRR